MITSTDIEQFVTEANDAIDTDPQMNEAMTKKAILDPFCNLLNWEFPDPGQVEYPVEAFGQQYWVDYAYAPQGTGTAFLEAKGVDTPLTDEARNQLKAYLTNGTAKLGILSNGQRYEFYRRVTDPELEVKQATALRLEQLPDHPRILQEFTHERLSDGGDDEMIDIIQETELYQRLRTNKAEIATELERTIVEQTGEDLPGDTFRTSIQSKIETVAKSAVDDLISQVEEGNSGETTGETDAGPAGRTERYALEILDPDTESTVFETTAEYQSDLMEAGVRYLIHHESLIDEIEPLPYIPGEKRAIVNTDPTYNGDEMAQGREVAGEYYLELNLSWRQKKRELRRMADACDVTVDIQAPDG